jgi:peptidoglycan/xylan/chitin deacetylase (PgdA/CDA1 family)
MATRPRSRTGSKLTTMLVIGLIGCSSPEVKPGSRTTFENPARVSPQPTSTPRDLRTQLDGRDFPDGAIALTFDDGPDAHTLELAEYLEQQKISATFFVVNAWVDDLSADPGRGDGVFASGAAFVPVLGDIVELGQRIANHTLNHVLLVDKSASVVREQLFENQRAIDPYVTDELRLFRAPAGAWDSNAASAVATDLDLADLVGPIRWDVDRKDWEGSLYCHSSHPMTECEAQAPGGARRVKPSVIAARYLASIDDTHRGIVLMHGRVGHVGSRYALDVAHVLIPQLLARDYVFVAPVLHFSRSRLRFPAVPEDTRLFDPEDMTAIALGDVDGDGRADLCASAGALTVCALSEMHTTSDGLTVTTFGSARSPTLDAERGLHLADINGDHRADLCTQTARGLECANAAENGSFGAARIRTPEFADVSRLQFADLDGDAKADVCAFSDRAIWCARSDGQTFERARVWLSDSDPNFGSSFAIADFNGDGLADVCGRSSTGLSCAHSNGTAFGPLRSWSTDRDFAASGIHLLATDLNGDGRADVCDQRNDGVFCALSNGHGFLHSTPWSGVDPGLARDNLVQPQVADINGDGRGDLCFSTPDGIACEVAP